MISDTCKSLTLSGFFPFKASPAQRAVPARASRSRDALCAQFTARFSSTQPPPRMTPRTECTPSARLSNSALTATPSARSSNSALTATPSARSSNSALTATPPLRAERAQHGACPAAAPSIAHREPPPAACATHTKKAPAHGGASPIDIHWINT